MRDYRMGEATESWNKPVDKSRESEPLIRYGQRFVENDEPDWKLDRVTETARRALRAEENQCKNEEVPAEMCAYLRKVLVYHDIGDLTEDQRVVLGEALERFGHELAALTEEASKQIKTRIRDAGLEPPEGAIHTGGEQDVHM